jgi:hypothetical protein
MFLHLDHKSINKDTVYIFSFWALPNLKTKNAITKSSYLALASKAGISVLFLLSAL